MYNKVSYIRKENTEPTNFEFRPKIYLDHYNFLEWKCVPISLESTRKLIETGTARRLGHTHKGNALNQYNLLFDIARQYV